ADLSEPLVHRNKQSHVLQKLADACSGRISSLLSDQVQPNQRQYAKLYADFLTNGIVSVYRDWIATGMQQPLEEIAKQISLLLKNGMAAFMA
ncbi:MAG: TetR-like C-terminal domain-containing protein, partial [Clostridia bacterium]|nr:TetR-like C-terminal domain-containing protein [Clostridia bacterium]